MLLEINIRNIALIESLTIAFSRGFHALTGETGAGKSIVVDSLNLALGGRADKEMIRTGADRAAVQALFDISNCPAAAEIAEEMGVPADDGLLTVSRELSAAGRNICRVSGMVVPLSSLRRLTAHLMDIHGQHEHQALLDPDRHMGFLDAFAPDAHRAAAADIAERYRARMRLAGSIKAARADAAGREREIDDIDRQLAEIEGAKLKPGEDEKLSARLALLENAERLRDGLSLSHALVYGGAGSAQEMLSRAVAAMERIAPVDARFEVLATRLKELTYAAQDIGYELRDALEEVESDPAALEKLSDRLDIIRRLKKRYGPELSDVLRRGDELRARRDELSGGDERAHAWRRELKDMDAALKAACAALSVSRHAVAQRLSEGVLSHLRDLGMEKARFEIRVQPEKITATGADRVEFLISPNPGEPLKPLSAIASGGEISRVMLALKAVSTAEYGVESMVFDEIDAGVSGRMAQAVGEKIARIARSRQVLCVTHLPQIAALADRHFAVEKGQVGGRTGTNVRLLDDEGRAREIARLVGGAEDEKSALMHARNLLAAAEKRRAELRQ